MSLKNISFRTVLQAMFTVLLSAHFSLGQLVSYYDGFKIIDIELTEEGDIEKEEKKEKEEIEEDEFLNKLFFCAHSDQEKLHVYKNSTLNWSASQAEVPTPPPRA